MTSRPRRPLLLACAFFPVGCHSADMQTRTPAAGAAAARPSGQLVGGVERLDPALDALVAPDARPEVLAQGYKWSEGPVWTGGAVLFSDVPNNVIWRWHESEGVREFLRPSGYTGSVPRGGEPGSNGLAVDGAGRLHMCQHGDRRIARLAPDGKSFETVADRYEGKRFNSPNDLVVRPNGDVYFSDPIYGLVGHEKDPAREIPWSGVYRARAGGGVANGRVFFDATSFVKAGKKGLPDGMKIDVSGNLFATGPGGVFVFSPAGKHLGTIVTGEPTANCAFGDDGGTLYMTANDKLTRIRLKTRGTVGK